MPPLRLSKYALPAVKPTSAMQPAKPVKKLHKARGGGQHTESSKRRVCHEKGSLRNRSSLTVCDTSGDNFSRANDVMKDVVFNLTCTCGFFCALSEYVLPINKIESTRVEVGLGKGEWEGFQQKRLYLCLFCFDSFFCQHALSTCPRRPPREFRPFA